MIRLLEVVGAHLPAVERDLVVAGYHFYDIGVRMDWHEFQSFVMAAPPNTATHTSRTGAWNSEAQMIDALRGGKPPVGGVGSRGHQAAAVRDGRGRNLRHEVHPPRHDPNKQVKNVMTRATAMPLDQFKSRMEQVNRERAEREGRPLPVEAG